MYCVWQHNTDLVWDKQVLCLGPTVKAFPSLSSVLIINIFGRTTLFGGTAQTGGVGISAVLIPPPTGLSLGAVDVAGSILVPVPGQAQVVSFILMIFRLCQGLTYLVLNFIPLLNVKESPRVERAALNPPSIRTYPSPSPTCLKIKLEIKRSYFAFVWMKKDE